MYFADGHNARAGEGRLAGCDVEHVQRPESRPIGADEQRPVVAGPRETQGEAARRPGGERFLRRVHRHDPHLRLPVQAAVECDPRAIRRNAWIRVDADILVRRGECSDPSARDIEHAQADVTVAKARVDEPLAVAGEIEARTGHAIAIDQHAFAVLRDAALDDRARIVLTAEVGEALAVGEPHRGKIGRAVIAEHGARSRCDVLNDDASMVVIAEDERHFAAVG